MAVRQRDALDAKIDDPALVDLAAHAGRLTGAATGRQRGTPARPVAPVRRRVLSQRAMNRRKHDRAHPRRAAHVPRRRQDHDLASVDRRGYPHLVAMWFTVDPDGTVLMTTFAKSQKAMNLRRDPRCTLLVETRHELRPAPGHHDPRPGDAGERRRATCSTSSTRIHRKYNGGEQPEGLRDILRAPGARSASSSA